MMKVAGGLCILLIAAFIALTIPGVCVAQAPPTPTPSVAPTPAISFGGVFTATQTLTQNVNASGNLAAGGGADQPSRFNISSAFINVTRNTGTLRYGASAGVYSIPVLGVSGNATLQAGANTNLYGPLPSAYVSLNPSDRVSITVGKLATLIGQEYTYTYLNANIQRGLVWNMETAVSRGLRLISTGGKYTGAVEVNDGFYSGRYLGVEGSLTLATDTNTSYQFVFVIPNASAPPNPTATIANKQLYNFMYTATRGRWTLAPYVLLVQSPKSKALGYTNSESAYGIVLITTYSLGRAWSVAGRVEDIANQSAVNDLSPNADLVGYGPGCGAWTFTLTPTYRYRQLLIRAEVSQVILRSATLGTGFGTVGNQPNQFRFVVESGLQF